MNTDRFWQKVQKTDGCWLWIAGKTGTGYGAFTLSLVSGEKQVKAHRFAYELLVGPVPEGLSLDHLCRVRHCVNPDHLEPVPGRENTLRGEGPTAQNARKTACIWGHELTGENLMTRGGRRQCRTCHRAQKAAYRKRKQDDARRRREAAA